MIDKLADEDRYMASAVANKINEIVDKFNEFRSQMEPLEVVIEDDGTVVWQVRSSE